MRVPCSLRVLDGLEAPLPIDGTILAAVRRPKIDPHLFTTTFTLHAIVPRSKSLVRRPKIDPHLFATPFTLYDIVPRSKSLILRVRKRPYGTETLRRGSMPLTRDLVLGQYQVQETLSGKKYIESQQADDNFISLIRQMQHFSSIKVMIVLQIH